MSALHGPGSEGLTLELAGVAEAAGNRLRAEVDGDEHAATAAAEALLAAATSALSRGISLSQVAEAEALGKTRVRDALRPATLKVVERTARQLRAAQSEHQRSILRAMRLGLSTRQVASVAGVTHGTIRAIAARLSTRPPDSALPESDRWAEHEQEEASAHPLSDATDTDQAGEAGESTAGPSGDEQSFG